MVRAIPVLGLVLLLVGCTTKKMVTITTRPPDASIHIDDVERAKGTMTEKFIFKGKDDEHTVRVSRLGFADRTVSLTRDFASDKLDVELKPMTRRVTFTVAPVAASISVDGRPLSVEPTESATAELEFTVDARDNWTSHNVTAQRPGYEPAHQLVRWQDKEPLYTVRMEPRKKDLTITTTPPGASLFLDNQSIGRSPATVSAHPFPPDPENGEAFPQKLKATLAGYPDVETKIGWDEGRSEYHVDLEPKSKTVRIVTEPSGAAVAIDGKELPRDKSGVSTAALAFPPVDAKGTPRSYSGTVTKKTSDSEWYPQSLVIGWDEGKTDYSVRLKEIRTRPALLLSPVLRRADDGWEVLPEITQTLAMKDVTEGSQKEPPAQLSQFPKGTQIDTLAVSPDGTQLLLTILLGTEKANFRSQMLMIKTDGSGGPVYLNDGKSLEITPVFTPGGERVVFASNRAGRRMSVWRMSANGAPGIEQLTTGDTNDLWPSIDSDPKPRLFYQATVDTRPDPRIYMTQLGTVTRTDLTQMGGSQPRVSPKADAIVFCGINDKTGKRDIYMMSDRGGVPQNLTNSPEIDEFDPAFSRDGTRLAYTSDAGVDEERRHNYDIWAIDIARPERPVQITTNGSWDDHPAFDPTGAMVYFRSNRGGDWAIWRIATK